MNRLLSFLSESCAWRCALQSLPRSAAQSRSRRVRLSYTISLASPEQHLVEVQIMLPAGAAERELQLPVWNALYQIRDFAQYVNWMRAKDRAGKPLAMRVDWTRAGGEIQGTRDGAIVEYQIYVDSPGPFGAQFNSHHAFFNLAQILMYPVDARNAPAARAFQPRPRAMAHRDSAGLHWPMAIQRRQLRPPGRFAR